MVRHLRKRSRDSSCEGSVARRLGVRSVPALRPHWGEIHSQRMHSGLEAGDLRLGEGLAWQLMTVSLSPERGNPDSRLPSASDFHENIDNTLLKAIRKAIQTVIPKDVMEVVLLEGGRGEVHCDRNFMPDEEGEDRAIILPCTLS